MPLSSKPINLRLHCDDLGPYVALSLLSLFLSLFVSLRSSLLILPTFEPTAHPIVSAPKAASVVEYARENITCGLRNVKLEFQSQIKVATRSNERDN